MALRLLNVARTLPSLLVPKLKPVQPPNRTIFKRERLVPFVDDDPCVFSTKAIMHHWGAVPIIVISAVSTGAAILTWLRLALTRIDVYYTASTAHCDNLETRQGPWYKPRYMKFYRINQQCETPRDLICAQQGEDSGSSSISLIGLVIKCGAIMLLALKKDDVWYTKDSAYYENFETRQGPWYKFRSRKWGGRDDYVMPPEAILARSGYVDGPPYSQDKTENDEDEGFSKATLAGHIVASSLAIGLASAVA